MSGAATVAPRGASCQAVVPDSTYSKAHPCEVKNGLHRVGRRTYCWMHPTKRSGGRDR